MEALTKKRCPGFPDLYDLEAVQKFFLQELQTGEDLIASGEYEEGIEHLSNAVVVCGSPQQLLAVIQQTLPPPLFQVLITRLPIASQRMSQAETASVDPLQGVPQLQDDDVE